MMKDKFRSKIQESQYEFPYHHIAHLKNGYKPTLSRSVGWWGLEYLCYQKYLVDKVSRMKPSSVLEVGCGDGVFIGSLPGSISVRVGIDYSERAIAFAKAFYPDCIFYASDLNGLQETFDIIVAIEVIEHIPDSTITEFFKRMAEKVSGGGCIIICVPTLVKPLSIKHYRHYSLELLQNQLVKSTIPFRVEDIEYIFAKPKWFDFGKKLFSNRLYQLENSVITKAVWKQIWNKYRIGNQETGHHLVAVLRKKNS